MWRSQILLNILYRSSRSFDEDVKKILDHPECKSILHFMLTYLKQFVEIPVPDIRCNNELDVFYNSLISTKNHLDCFKKLPLEWQVVLLTHLQNSCAFQKNKQVKGFPDVEYILPSTLKLFTNLTSQEYWREMMNLSVEYAYGNRDLPNIDEDLRRSPSVKGSEAVLYKLGFEEESSTGSPNRLCLMQNLKTISPSLIPNIVLSQPVRVFSDQQLPDEMARFPQPELEKLIEGQNLYDLAWKCGYIWTHTYPFWHWENGQVRLDITVPESTVVMYTPFSETYMFTSMFDASRHMTLLLKPGKLVTREINRVPRPLQHGTEDMGTALHTDQFITVIKCDYIGLQPNLSQGSYASPVQKKQKIS